MDEMDAHNATAFLSSEQIQTYLRDGVLVVPDVLSPDELQEAIDGLTETLGRHGVDVTDLRRTGHNLQKLSSTNGSGGVLDLFYDTWKLRVASSPRLFRITTELWQAAYCHEGENREDLPTEERHRWHPFGQFDPRRGYMYVDRIGYRIPSALAEDIGLSLNDKGSSAGAAGASAASKRKRKQVAIQRSLTPHLDCCPETYLAKNKAEKWRPIQCFVSLTTNVDPDTGGFEAAGDGFHREFDAWARNRPPGARTGQPAPCLGQYTHLRPVEDRDVFQRVQHVPVRAGSAVLWDNRTPHANAYRNVGNDPRAVVYCSFLPDVPVNRSFVERQRRKLLRGMHPTDQWINGAKVEDEGSARDVVARLSTFQRQLLGLDDWDSGERGRSRADDEAPA